MTYLSDPSSTTPAQLVIIPLVIWRTLKLEEDDILVSHDVLSLFTNAPVKESLDITSTRLEQVSDWQDTMMLEKDDILELLEFVLTTTYFAFRDEIIAKSLVQQWEVQFPL